MAPAELKEASRKKQLLKQNFNMPAFSTRKCLEQKRKIIKTEAEPQHSYVNRNPNPIDCTGLVVANNLPLLQGITLNHSLKQQQQLGTDIIVCLNTVCIVIDKGQKSLQHRFLPCGPSLHLENVQARLFVRRRGKSAKDV